MTKTPVTAAPGPTPSMGECYHGPPDELVEPVKQQNVRGTSLHSGNLTGTVPQLVVTCEPSPSQTEQKATRSSGLCVGSHLDEESICSDSGIGGSPAPSLVLRKLSNASSAGLSPASSFEEYEDYFSGCNEPNATLTQNSGVYASPSPDERSDLWKKTKSMVNWSPFVAPLKRRCPWVQVVGHAGNFQTGADGKLLKKFCECEQQCLQKLMGDTLRPFVPGYYGVTQRDEQDYNLMDDLLTDFDSPSIMDCKMGSRTYLEEELGKARQLPQPRKDMYEKMVAVDPEAPTAEERAQQAVLKTRYMQWRETLSSTATLGFRIEGIKKTDGNCNTDFKRTKCKDEVTRALEDFVDRSIPILKSYQRQLKELRIVLEKSDFFRSHEVVGSSLLFVHDRTGKAGVWMIDFGKSVPMPPPLTLDHRTPWVEGNREDGYLWGLDNFIDILTNMLPVV